MINSSFDIVKVMTSLSDDKRYFTSERDFQLQMGLKIMELYGSNSTVMLEVPYERQFVDSTNEIAKNIRIDLVVEIGGNRIPIELKYKTKRCRITTGLGSDYYLKTHGAQDEGCYGFAKDICRVNDFVKKNYNSDIGYCVFLTNDKRYTGDYSARVVDYKSFWINTLKSGDNLKGIVSADTKILSIPPFSFLFDDWKDYGELISDTQFVYKIAKVTK